MTGDFTAINVEEGVTVELLDFYNPGRGTPAYLKLYRKTIGMRYVEQIGQVIQTWNPVQ